MSTINLPQEGATPAAPSAGRVLVYAKSDGLYSLDSEGVERGPFGAGGGGSSRVYDEVLAGSVDGQNVTFMLPRFIPGSQVVVMNGMRLRAGASNDYIVAEMGGQGTGYNAVVFTEAPSVGTVLVADYEPA